MSLINDALKRANQAARQKSGQSSPAGASMQPVAPLGGALRGRSNVVAILLLVVIGLAGLFFVLWWNTRQPSPATARHPAGRPESVTTASVAADPAPTPELSADTKRPRIQINTNIVIRELPAAVIEPRTSEPPSAGAASASAIPTSIASKGDPSAAEALVAPASFPAVKLQGVFFRLKNPEAVVNGRILRVGESISGARVTRIDRREVVIEWNGQSKTLSLDGP